MTLTDLLMGPLARSSKGSRNKRDPASLTKVEVVVTSRHEVGRGSLAVKGRSGRS